MKPTMKPSALATSIVVALFSIRHDGTDYETGDLFEVPKTQAVFLHIAKCVREPTASEIEAWQEKQEHDNDTVNTALATNDATQLAHPVESITTHKQKHQEATSDDMSADVVDTNDEAGDAVVTGKAVDAPEAITETDTVSETQSDVKANPYNGWLKKDLNAELDKRGIEHDAGARNDVLEQLLVADDASKV